jgi:hypothetical protein
MGGFRRFLNTVIDEGLASLPIGVAEHLTNSKKEFLLAIRALLDEELKWSDVHLARARDLKAKRAQERAAGGKTRRA